MVDAALNVAAEQVIEHSAYGALLERSGNRGPLAAPQNLYESGDVDAKGRGDTWVAIAVETDEQWTALGARPRRAGVGGRPALATAAGSASSATTRSTPTCRRGATTTLADDIVDRLWAAGVPVAKVIQPHDQPDLPPIQHRGFFEELDHPVIGRSRYSTLPMTLLERTRALAPAATLRSSASTTKSC